MDRKMHAALYDDVNELFKKPIIIISRTISLMVI